MANGKRAMVNDAGNNAMIPLTRHLGKNRRMLVIAGGVVAALLAVGGYVLWSGSSWSAYHASHVDWKHETKSTVDDVLRLPAGTVKLRSTKLKALGDRVSILTADAGSRCRPNGMVSWQASINATYKKWQQECEADAVAIGKLNEELMAVSAYLKSEHALAGVLSDALAATSGKLTEKSFSAVLGKWKTATAGVTALRVPTQFEAVKSKAQKNVDNAAAAWQSLVKAHAAKNEADYNAAIKAVAEAYSSLDDIETISTNTFAKLAAQLQKAYDAAF